MSAPFKLVIFDLDGVLVPIDSSWQYVHRAFGRDNEDNYRKYLRGEIDYEEFMRSDIALWDGTSVQTVKAILDQVPLAEGAQELTETLRKNKIHTAIISSGISLLADRVGQELRIDRVYANKLIADDKGRLTGEGITVVPLRDKLSVIKRILEEERVSPQESAVVGNSIFDFPDLDIGLSIAFSPQDEESEVKADLSIEGRDLRLLLPWLTSGPPNKMTIYLAMGAREAKSVAAALSPDNMKVPQGLYVKVFAEDGRVCMKIVSVRGLGTLLATVDDLLSCSHVATSSIDAAKSLQRTKTI